MPLKRKASKRKTKKAVETVPKQSASADDDEACNVTVDGQLTY